MHRHLLPLAVVLMIALLSLVVPPSTVQAATAPAGFRLPFIGSYSIGTGPCAQHASSSYIANHEALDFVMPSGTAVIAAAAGTAQTIWDNGGGGNVVLISQPNGLKSVYAHLSAFKVTSGAQVSKSQLDEA